MRLGPILLNWSKGQIDGGPLSAKYFTACESHLLEDPDVVTEGFFRARLGADGRAQNTLAATKAIEVVAEDEPTHYGAFVHCQKYQRR